MEDFSFRCAVCKKVYSELNQQDIHIEGIGGETLREYGPFCPTCCHRIEKAIIKQMEAPL